MMAGFRFPSLSVSPKLLRTIGPVALALLAVLPQAWSSTFTLANNTFPSTVVGNSTTQNVTLAVNTAVPITSISIAPGFTEYSIVSVTGCAVNSSGTTIVSAGSICTISVTYSPAMPGSAVTPTLGRNAPLLVSDIESGNPVSYAFGLTGSATAAVNQLEPATLSLFAGAPLTGMPALAQGLGQTTAGYGGNNGPANEALFSFYSYTAPAGCSAYGVTQPMARDSAGNLYVIDPGNLVIRKIDNTSQHNVTIVAGVPGKGSSTTVFTNAYLNTPNGIVVDAAGNIYFLDTSYCIGGFGMVRRVDAVTGTITSIAGQNFTGIYNSAGGGTCTGSLDSPGYTWECGDGGLASYASIPYGAQLAMDAAGNLYVWEAGGGGYVRKIDLSTGIISTAASAAQLGALGGQGGGMTLGADGNLYVSVDTGTANYIEQFNPNTQAVTAIAGGGLSGGNYCTVSVAQAGYAGTNFFDDGTNSSSGDLSGDGSGNIYMDVGLCNGDYYTYEAPAVWRINPTTKTVFLETKDETGGGATVGYNSYFGYETDPQHVLADSLGDLYLVTYNQIALLSGTSGALNYTDTIDYTTHPQTLTATYANVGNAVEPNPSGTFASGINFVLNSSGDAAACTAIAELAIGGSCDLNVEFTPVQAGSITDTLDLTEAAGGTVGLINNDQTLSLNGSALAEPLISFVPPAINFPAQVENTVSAAQAVTISNPGTGTLILDGIFPDGGTFAGFEVVAGGTCPPSGSGTLASGASCTIMVAFDPPGLGPYDEYLNVNNTASTSGSLIASTLTGTGVSELSPAATPVITPAAGTYNASIAVQITDSSASPTIYYTTDGSAPSTTTSPTYTAPFTVSQTGTEVQAIATAPSATSVSATASATYTIQTYLAFSPAAVGIAPGSSQQLTAAFSLMGSTVPTAALHYGIDYTAGSVTCTPNGAIEVCTVPVNFIPTEPGQRKDALVLSSGGSAIATVYLGGIGQAPLSLIEPGVITNINPTATYDQYSSAIDENGTVYVISSNSPAGSNVFSVTKGGVVTTLPITATSPNGIAIDGAGMLYIAQNTFSKTLVTYNTVTGVQGTLSVIPPAPYVPCSSAEYLYSVAVDDLGNVFALDIECQEIFELKTDGTYVTTAINPAITQPGYIAIDSADDVFVGGYDINEIMAGGGQTQPNTVGDTEGLGADAAGTLYVGRYSTGEGVYQVAGPGYTGSIFQLDPSAPALGLGLGSDGTVYVGNYSALDKVDRSQGAIAFGEQSTGVASSAQIVDVYNGGNESLTVSNIVLTGASSGFAIQPGTSNECTKGDVIAPGTLCELSVTLTAPHAGVFSGSISITSNSLYNSSTTQNVALSGFVYGVYVTASPSPVPFGNQTDGTPSAPMLVTLTNNGDLYTASLGAPSGYTSAYTISPGTCSSETLAPAASCQLSITFDPSAPGPYDQTVTIIAASSGGGPTQNVTFDLTGTGTSAAPLPQAINFTQPATPVTYAAGLTIPLVATGGASGNPVVFSIDASSTGTGTISGSTLTVTGVGTIVIDANQAGNSSYSAAPQVQKSVVVTQAAQVINFTAPASPVTFTSGLTVALVATGGASGNPVVFSIDASSTGTGTISGSTLTVTGTGSIVIDANQAGNANYSAATQVQRTVLLNKAAQTINFTAPASPVTFTSGLTVALVATGGASGNPVVFTIDASSTGTGTISGSTLTVTGAGNIVIDANQAGNANYSAAPQVQHTLVVNKAAQTINFTQPSSPIGYTSGLTISLVATGGASGNAVVFTIDASSTGTGTISGSTLTVTSIGTLVIDANQAGNANYSAAPQVQKTIVVNSLIAQAINFTQPASPVTYAPGLTIPLVATGGASGNPVVFSIDGSSTGTGTISGSTLTVTGVGTIVIDANQAGNSTYSAAPQVQKSVVVNQAAQAILFAQPASPVTYASSLTIALSATGGASGDPIVFTIDTSSTGTGTISGSTLTVTGVGSLVIDANQAGNSNYTAAAQVQRTLVVSKAAQAINFTQPSSPITYVSGLTVALTASGGASGNAVVFTIDPSSTGTGTVSGSTLTVTGTGTLVIDANQAGNGNYTAAAQVEHTLIVVAPIPQAITFAQPASPIIYAPSLTVSLTATGGASGNPVVLTIDASSTGTGTISGSTLTITGVGSFVIDANQAGNATYTAATQVQRTVVVNQAPQAINFTQPASPVVFSTGLTITLTATGGASGSAVVFTIDASSTAKGTISGSTVTVTGVGNLVIDANQAGNADYSVAPQVQRTVLINAPPPNFTIGATPPAQSIAAGASAAYTVTVGSMNGAFNDVVTLSATGLPTGATGTFTPTTINPGSGSGNSTFTVQLPAVQTASTRGSSWPLATPALALLILLPFRRWRRAWRGKLLLLIACLVSLAGVATLTGCGGGFLLGNPAQSYTVTVTGTSGTDIHSTTVQLTVQ